MFNFKQLRLLIILPVTILIVGTIIFMVLEDLSFGDALYFTIVTISTVGYGDLAPTKIGSKIFTIMYIFMGIGILLGFVEKMTRTWYQKSTETQKAVEADTTHPGEEKSPVPGHPHDQSDGKDDSADIKEK